MIHLIIVPTSSTPMMRDPRSYLPLKPVDLLLLLALADDEQHGYALVQSIAERTEGIVELEPGNLYRIIKRLLADGLVAESERRPAPDLDDERRRYYRLTSLGARVAAEETRRLRSLVASPSVRALTRRWAT
ncbi:MAG: helix-turn-helix transcriptional regulator [Gemmatimonadaceae bacterium]